MEFSLGSIFASLDMDYSNGLVDGSGADVTAFQRYFFSQTQKKLGIDAIYFLRDTDGIPKIPMIYFSAMDSYDSAKIAELHRLAWNMGEAPLLFVVLPDQLLIYNNYEIPATKDKSGKYDNEKGLFEKISQVYDLDLQWKRLRQFRRTQIETGEFWRINNARFDIKNRVDTTLIENLKAIRKELLVSIKERAKDLGLDDQTCSEIVHSLLGRSILIKYLEERTDSNGRSVFPNGFFEKFFEGAGSYTEVLSDKNATYLLFESLTKKFNGDIFPVSENEARVITQEDLTELQQFLLGKCDHMQQTVLWPLYSFNVIPIQLISSIYELFFHLAETDPEKDKGTYYTPYHLVEMLMDEVLPWEGSYSAKRILDPACGSGVFLVEAYRRLVGRWILSEKPKRVSPNKLIDIMEDCIFGVDCNAEAVRVASFSLSLAMCDFLEPRTIWDELQFPRLLHYNLFNCDFFDDESEFKSVPREFDLVIGNPPWESILSPTAKRYIRTNGYIVSDNQIAQAFTWRVGEVCSNGVICLLLPSKSFLFNRSEPAKQFRRRFFSAFTVSVIINYSAFRWVLFEHAVSPAVGVIYHKKAEKSTDPIFYCTPKPLYTIEDRRRFLVEPNNICRIPEKLISDDSVWKVAMWGNPRDLELIHKMREGGTTFRELFETNAMVYAEGFKQGNKKKKTDFFKKYPFLDAKTFWPGMSRPDDPRFEFDRFERTVETKQDIFRAPHLIIKQSHKGSRFLAEVLNFDAVFSHSFLGVHGDERLLKYCCLVISSKTFAYYQMMTNRKWLVERDEVEAGDILDAPIFSPDEDSLAEAEQLYTDILGKDRDLSRVDQFVYHQYMLQPYEISLIEDAIDYVYDFYHKRAKSRSLVPPSPQQLADYYRTLKEVLNNTLGKNAIASCRLYQGDAPLAVAEVMLSKASMEETSFCNKLEEMDNLLQKLDKQLLEERSGSVYVRRNVRIYSRDSICIVKPNQARYWNYSSACRDADEIYSDTMRTWRNYNE